VNGRPQKAGGTIRGQQDPPAGGRLPDAVLDPDVVLRADRAAVKAGASRELRGAAAVAETFKGRARAAQPAIVN
jgi:hypothetical protein